MRSVTLQTKFLIPASLIISTFPFTLPNSSAQDEKKPAHSANKSTSDKTGDSEKKKTRTGDDLLAFLKKIQTLIRIGDEQSGLLQELHESLKTFHLHFADKEKIERQVKIQLDEFRNQIKRDFLLSKDSKNELIANEEKKIREGVKVAAKYLRDAIDDVRHELIGLRIRKTILLLPDENEGPVQKWMDVIETKQQDEKHTFRKRRTTSDRQLLYLQLAYVEFLKFKQVNHDFKAEKIDVISRQLHEQLASKIANNAQSDKEARPSKLTQPELEKLHRINLRIEADVAGMEFLESLAVHQLHNHEDLVGAKTETSRLNKNSKELERQIQALKNELHEIEVKEERKQLLRTIGDRNDALNDLKNRAKSLQNRVKDQLQEAKKNEKEINKIWKSINIFPAEFYSCWFGNDIKTQKDAIRKLLDVAGSKELAKEFSEPETAK